MDKVTLFIDDIKVETRRGEKILWAALDNGIYIPNLCAVRETMEPWASCRLCFVEVAGRNDPVTACTEEAAEGMVVHTRSPKVNRLRRSSLELLFSSHTIDCKNCFKRKECELLKIAGYLKIKLNSLRFRNINRSQSLDESNPAFIYDPGKCVLCGRCVWVCREKKGVGAINFAFRGFNTSITTFSRKSQDNSDCISCAECITVCPVGALIPKANPEIVPSAKH